MQLKRYTTEEKIRILRDAASGKNVVKLCRKKNISEQTFRRWKRTLATPEIPEATRQRKLGKRNSELKKMLTDSLLKQRALEIVNAKQ